MQFRRPWGTSKSSALLLLFLDSLRVTLYPSCLLTAWRSPPAEQRRRASPPLRNTYHTLSRMTIQPLMRISLLGQGIIGEKRQSFWAKSLGKWEIPQIKYSQECPVISCQFSLTRDEISPRAGSGLPRMRGNRDHRPLPRCTASHRLSRSLGYPWFPPEARSRTLQRPSSCHMSERIFRRRPPGLRSCPANLHR